MQGTTPQNRRVFLRGGRQRRHLASCGGAGGGGPDPTLAAKWRISHGDARKSATRGRPEAAALVTPNTLSFLYCRPSTKKGINISHGNPASETTKTKSLKQKTNNYPKKPEKQGLCRFITWGSRFFSPPFRIHAAVPPSLPGLRKEQPSVSRARPPVGWQSMTSAEVSGGWGGRGVLGEGGGGREPQ